MDILTADTDLVLIVVDDQFSHCIGAVPGDFVITGDGAGVADRGADPGQEFVRAEGLGEVVIRPQIQCGDLVPLMGAGGDHHHRQAGPAAQAAEDVQTIHVRQAEVQNDQVGTVGGDHGKRLLAGLGLHGFIAVVVEDRGNEVRDALLVLNYQNFFTNRHDTSSLVSGRQKENSAPDSRFFASNVPPWARMIAMQTDRPSPMFRFPSPGDESSQRSAPLNRVCSFWGGMPWPLSRT